jgi:hypothetical protein
MRATASLAFVCQHERRDSSRWSQSNAYFRFVGKPPFYRLATADLDRDPGGFFGRMIERFVKALRVCAQHPAQKDCFSFRSPIPGMSKFARRHEASLFHRTVQRNPRADGEECR